MAKNKLGIQDLRECLKIYYSCHELGSSEIMKLLGVSESRASTMKNEVRKKMAEQNVMAFDKSCINTEIAFKVWGIDIDDVEKRVKKLEKLGFYPAEATGGATI